MSLLFDWLDCTDGRSTPADGAAKVFDENTGRSSTLDDDEPAGEFAHRQQLGGRNDDAAERQRRQLDRLRAGRDDDVLRTDRLLAARLGGDDDGLAVAQTRTPEHHLHARLLQQARDAGV